jgi:CheY-like chemotaxis protein
MKVLVVDDEQIMRDIVIEKLSQIGIKSVVEAASVPEAKKILTSEEKFDLIVSDYTMPGDHGGDLLRFLYANKISLPFILFTSSINLDLPPTDTNFLGIVAKPDLARLTSTVKSVFSSKKS